MKLHFWSNNSEHSAVVSSHGKIFCLPRTKIICSPVVNEENTSEENIWAQARGSNRIKLRRTSYFVLFANWVMKSWRMTWEGYVARIGEMGNAHEVLVENPDWKRKVWSPQRRWDDNI
jgi:hypothetical protein